MMRRNLSEGSDGSPRDVQQLGRARGGALDLPDVGVALDDPKETPEVAARETRHELDKKAGGGAAGLAVGPARRARGRDAAGLALAR